MMTDDEIEMMEELIGRKLYLAQRQLLKSGKLVINANAFPMTAMRKAQESKVQSLRPYDKTRS